MHRGRRENRWLEEEIAGVEQSQFAVVLSKPLNAKVEFARAAEAAEKIVRGDGDDVVFQAPGGEREYEVVSVEYL